MEDAMPERTGREPATELMPEDWATVQRITSEILAGMDCVNTRKFERHILSVLVREIASANDRYAAQVADEEIHKWEFGQHHISECRIDWCGRYRGQRRDSQPPAIPGTPTGYCRACAASGVGCCDDFPNCPG